MIVQRSISSAFGPKFHLAVTDVDHLIVLGDLAAGAWARESVPSPRYWSGNQSRPMAVMPSTCAVANRQASVGIERTRRTASVQEREVTWTSHSYDVDVGQPHLSPRGPRRLPNWRHPGSAAEKPPRGSKGGGSRAGS